jgi:hypothetical protein
MKMFSPSTLLMMLCATAFLSPSSVQAGGSNKSGNPYGNGTFFPTTGTFTGVLRGVNIVGVTQFSTSTNSNTLTGGTVVIYDASTGLYNDGLGVYATLDPSANSLNALILPSTNNALTTGASANIFQGGGSFNASLSTQPPNQTYSGNGVITQVLNTNNPTTNPPVNQTFVISGCRIGN